jgi:hypothetical protein
MVTLPQLRNPRYSVNRRLGGLQSRSERFRTRKISSPARHWVTILRSSVPPSDTDWHVSGKCIQHFCFTGGSKSGHVFHLHGYSFYVVGVTQLDEPTALTRIQELDNRDSLLSRNLVNPVLKDTVTVPSNGLSVLRFKADNPGKPIPCREEPASINTFKTSGNYKCKRNTYTNACQIFQVSFKRLRVFTFNIAFV